MLAQVRYDAELAAAVRLNPQCIPNLLEDCKFEAATGRSALPPDAGDVCCLLSLRT